MTNHVFNIYNPARRSSFVDYSAAIDAEIRKLARITRTPYNVITPPPPRKGDKIKADLVGYVSDIASDGTITLVDKRSPFPAEEATVVGTIRKAGKTTFATIERAPAEPKVGDEITAAQLKATPWKRGTQIHLAGSSTSRYVLTARGEWRSVETGELYPFSAFSDYSGPWRVEHAPGK